MDVKNQRISRRKYNKVEGKSSNDKFYIDKKNKEE
jgi:hypothetical protein